MLLNLPDNLNRSIMDKKAEKKSIDFINEPEKISNFSMKDILGGNVVQSYVDCPNVHHAPDSTKLSRLDVW